MLVRNFCIDVLGKFSIGKIGFLVDGYVIVRCARCFKILEFAPLQQFQIGAARFAANVHQS